MEALPKRSLQAQPAHASVRGGRAPAPAGAARLQTIDNALAPFPPERPASGGSDRLLPPATKRSAAEPERIAFQHVRVVCAPAVRKAPSAIPAAPPRHLISILDWRRSRHRRVLEWAAIGFGLSLLFAMLPGPRPEEATAAAEAAPQLSDVVRLAPPARPMLSGSVVPVAVDATTVSARRPVGTSGERARAMPAGRFRGRLIVDSEPRGATVLINQEKAGVTPLDLSRYPAASYAVWVEHPGYRRWSAGVLVPANRVTRVKARLQKEQ